MIKLEIGAKLYTCSEYHLLVFLSEEMAAAAAVVSAVRVAVAAARAGAYYADWWSKELKCHVSFIPAGQVFCMVEIGGSKNGFRQVHVVAGEAMGWINVGSDWLNIKELAD